MKLAFAFGWHTLQWEELLAITQRAEGVTVTGYHCEPGAGMAWPDDWAAMEGGAMAGADIEPGGETVVGPFVWEPAHEGHECMLAVASAVGDPANDRTVGRSMPMRRLVPFDNNIAQRNVAPVAGGGGIGGLVDSFTGRTFRVRNPEDRTVQVRV